MRSSGWRGAGDEPPGIRGLDDRDRRDPRTAGTPPARCRRRTPPAPRPGELPVDQQQSRPAARARRRDARGSCPTGGRRARARRRRAASRSCSRRWHRSRLAWTRATRSWAAALRSSSSSCGGSGKRQRPHPVDAAGRRLDARPPGADAGPPSVRPSARAGMRGKRAAMVAPVAAAGRRAQDQPAFRRLVMDDGGHLARQSGVSASARRTAASCASVSALRGPACLTTNAGPARVEAMNTQFRRETSTTTRSSSTTSRGLTRPSDRR